MSRFILVILFVLGIVAIFSLNNVIYKVDNKKFNFNHQKELYENHLKEVRALTSKSSHEKKGDVQEVEEVVVKGPLVELTTDSLKNGFKLFKKCAICHGKNGTGKKAQKAPNIAGQFDWYIEKQIKDMKNGVRVNKIMTPYIKKLKIQDIKDLANYISKLPWKSK